MTGKYTRRSVIKRAAAAGAAATVPRRLLSQPRDEPGYRNLSAAEAATLEAVVARLIPNDDNGPGALEAGAVTYIDRALGDALAPFRDAYSSGLAAVESYARATTGRAFSAIGAAQQDAILTAVEQNRAGGFTPDSATFFAMVLGHTLEGTFCDPHYGGNRDFIGWAMIGYPGLRLAVAPAEQDMDADLAPTEISAYDLPMFDEDSA